MDDSTLRYYIEWAHFINEKINIQHRQIEMLTDSIDKLNEIIDHIDSRLDLVVNKIRRNETNEKEKYKTNKKTNIQ